MSPRIGPYSPLAAILAKAGRGYIRAPLVGLASSVAIGPGPGKAVACPDCRPHMAGGRPAGRVANLVRNFVRKHY
jgi:hypothetical protein